MIAANIKLDYLRINRISFGEGSIEPTVAVLNTFYLYGVYKKVRLYLQIEDQDTLDLLATVNGLVTICDRHRRDIPLKFSELKFGFW